MASCVSVGLQRLNSVCSNNSYADLDDSKLSAEERKAKESFYRSIFEMVRQFETGSC